MSDDEREVVKRSNDMLIVIIRQMELRLDIDAEESKKQWKKKLLAPMRQELNRDSTVVVCGRSWINEFVTW